jgi:hypothetical protein
MRAIAIAGFVAIATVLFADPAGGPDWANPPLAVAASRVELTVGRELTLVSDRSMLQYVERDDAGHSSRLIVHYPLYVEKGLRDWRDAATAADIKLQVGEQTLRPVDGDLVSPEFLSEFPIPEDAGVAVLSFEIPRSLAKLRFEVVISHVQPNFHYRGALLAAYTPWLPKMIKTQKVYGFANEDFSVAFRPLSGIKFRKFTAHPKVVADTPAEFSVVPEHRKTIAVEILPEDAPPAQPAESSAKAKT